MKLLFTTTTDLKSLLGFLDAGLTFDNYKTDLEHATLDLIKLIGSATYTKIQTYFEDVAAYTPGEDDPSAEEMATLLKYAQLPIALFANLAIESNTDLSHTNSGRTVKVSEYEKQPWEWQIEKDNASQRRRAYKALDILIEELDTLNVTEWIQSEEYKQSKEYFIHTTTLFEKVYPINNSRQLYLRLFPFMDDAEEEFIEPAIGITRFEALKETILDDALTAVDKILLKRINKVVGFFVLADSFKTLPVEMFPEGIIEYREKGRMTSQARGETMEFFFKKAKYHLVKLENYISELDVVDTEISETITGLEDGTKFINL